MMVSVQGLCEGLCTGVVCGGLCTGVVCVWGGGGSPYRGSSVYRALCMRISGQDSKHDYNITYL